MIDLQDINVGNPFPGLRPFETDEYHLFFGREGQSDELIKRLSVTRFLAVVGTSGSGKSSLIRAGLLPALHGGLMPGAGSSWRVALIRPGHDPIGNLAHELGAILDDGHTDLEIQNTLIETTLRRSTLGLVDAVRQARMSPHEKLLVVVDQFEELFRFKEARKETDSEDDALGFVKSLIEASAQVEVPIYVVLTMRSDFLGDCSQFAGLPEAINQGQYLIPRMSRDERRAAITGPVAVGGGEMTVPLINRLLNDVGDNPDQLPILQHALMRTWDYSVAHRRNGEAIGLDHYEAIGSMAEALSRHADEAFNELPNERSRLVAEKIFKALTEQGVANRETRRPVPLHQLCSIAGATETEVVDVIETFRSEGRSFLMPPTGTTLKLDTIIDISHESLIRNWGRLHEWVNEEARSAQIYRRLAEAAVLYHRKEEGLLGGPFLQIALEWREKQAPNRVWAYRYNPEFETASRFLDASRDDRDAKLAAQERELQEKRDSESRELKQAAALAEKEKRLAEAEKQRAEEQAAARQRELEQAQAFAAQQTRAASRLKRLTFALVLISLLALGAAGGAAYAYTLARSNQKLAEESEQRTRDLAGDLETSQQKVEAGKQEVRQGRSRAEALQRKADDKEQQALEEQKKAAQAKVDAEKAARIAKEAKADATTALNALSAATENDRRNREALAALQRGNLNKAETAFEALATTYQNNQDPSLLAWAKSHLGETRRQLGKLDESIEILAEARQIQQRVLPSQLDPSSLVFKDKGATRDEKARDITWAAALIWFKRNEEYLDTLNWLALAHNNKGQYDLAEPLYLEALKIKPSASGLEQLARNYDNMGQSEEAEEYYNKALNLRRKNTLSPDLATTLREVAQFYLEQDERETAIKLYEEALTNQEEYLEPYDPNIADTFTGLAQVYEETPYKQRAKLLNQLAREIRRSGLTRRDPDPDNFAVLAWSYAAVGKYRQAGRLLIRAQEIEDRKNGPQAPGLAHSLIRRGDFFGVLAQSAPKAADSKQLYAEGVSAYNRALEISTKSSQLTSRLEALDGLAQIQLAQNNFAEAEGFYKLAVEIRDQKHQATDIQLSVVKDAYKAELAMSLYGLGRAAAGLEKYSEAEAHFIRTQEVLAGLQGFLRKYVDGKKPYALFLQHASRARLAEIYGKQGRVNEAGEQYRPLAETLKAIRGDALKDENIAHAYLDIVEIGGKFYAERGDVAAAESFYRLVFPNDAWPSVQTVPVWPEAFSKSLVAMAPTSCLDSMVRILESYAALLEKAGRAKDAGLISHGVVRLVERKVAEEGQPPR